MKTPVGIATSVLLILSGGCAPLLPKRSRSVENVAPVQGSVVRVHTRLVDLYGARAGDRILLFDTGGDPQGRGVDALLEHMGAKRADVSHVFITHSHLDHYAAATLLRNAVVHVGAGDRPIVAHERPTQPWLSRTLLRSKPVPALTNTVAVSEATEIDVGETHTVRAIPCVGH